MIVVFDVNLIMSRLVLTTETELIELGENRTARNTRYSTQYAVNLYQQWREEHAQLGDRFAPLDCGVPSILNYLIPKFLVEIRKKNGELYHPESLRSIYFGINRYLVEQDATMSLVSAPEFLTCRQQVDGNIKKLQTDLNVPQKKQAAAVGVIQQEEMWQSGLLGPATPQSLVDAIIWSCGRYFALRGKEELRGIRKHTVEEGTGVAESIAKRVKLEEDLNATLMMIEEMGSDEFDELMDLGEHEDNNMKSVGTGTTAVLPIDLSSITIEVTMNIGQINIPSDTESELIDNGTSKKVGTELSFHANADIKFKVE